MGLGLLMLLGEGVTGLFANSRHPRQSSQLRHSPLALYTLGMSGTGIVQGEWSKWREWNEWNGRSEWNEWNRRISAPPPPTPTLSTFPWRAHRPIGLLSDPLCCFDVIEHELFKAAAKYITLQVHIYHCWARPSWKHQTGRGHVKHCKRSCQ